MKLIGFTGHRNKQADPHHFTALAAEFPGAVWLHGGAEGFDAQVQAEAKRRGIETLILRPIYGSQYYPSRVAPLVRNESIVSLSVLLVACYDGRESGGTVRTVEFAREAGREVRVWEATG